MSGTKRGLFVVIEGIDGAGTTTQARKLTRALQRNGKDAVFTFEPTDGPIGSMIRQVLRGRMVTKMADNSVKPFNADTMTLLFSADRLDHNENLIKPALDKNKTVICDRYYYSTIAYQGVDGDMDWVKQANSKASKPDLVFYLKIDPKISLKRIGNRSESEIYEKVDFLEKVSQNYDKLFESLENTIVLDAGRSLEELAAEIRRVVLDRI